ncbi:MAG: hypothetical protein HQL37_00890 [Alphaproteobacteria bacterium]|nr:hypothetical protein [Alphaproteobacteria bacterium]
MAESIGEIEQQSAGSSNISSLVDQFVDGTVQLDCGASCSDTFAARRPAMLAMYRSNDWVRLSREVVTIGYDQDLAWFYLGQSAQGLGLGDAAVKYYLYAMETPSKCLDEMCDGFIFPERIERQLSHMSVP